MVLGLVAKKCFHILLIGQSRNCLVEVAAVQMAAPFFMVGNVGVKPHVYQLAIVAQLTNQHITEVRDLCNLLE
eukprot:3022330-Ditylum_brightwellii.AAC.1